MSDNILENMQVYMIYIHGQIADLEISIFYLCYYTTASPQKLMDNTGNS